MGLASLRFLPTLQRYKDPTLSQHLTQLDPAGLEPPTAQQ